MSSQPEQQRAADIIRLLTLYRPLLDAYVIVSVPPGPPPVPTCVCPPPSPADPPPPPSPQDFFAEGLWAQLPPPWQAALATAAPPQLAGLLGGDGGPGGVAWPLSLLAFAAAARALAFPRGGPGAGGTPRPPCQSPLLHPLFRRHVKPKKQHEIRRMGKVGGPPPPIKPLGWPTHWGGPPKPPQTPSAPP